MIFEILTFDFYLEAIVNYCLYECNHIILKKMKELVYPHPILCVASKFVCKHYDKAIHRLMEKMVNYCAEI